jgi:inosine-uridine nucleoside N-ribohydrolase
VTKEGAVAQRVILDVDTGTDDAVALMLAALHPDIELVAATTVNGNVPLELTTENTLRVFDLLGESIPVHAGLAQPLVRHDFPRPREDRSGHIDVHGRYLDIPPATSRARDRGAVEFLIDTYMSTTDEIILVPTGPLSNVGAALSLEPRLAERIPEMVIMGGGHEVGNVTPSAEFNIWADPEAARVVLTSGVRRITLVPLDATHRALVSLDDCAAMRALGTPAGQAAAAFIERRIHGYDAGQPMDRPHSAPVHDALCIAAIVDRSIITTRRCHVDVETHGELTVGRTVIDTHRRGPHEPNADVAFDADERRFAAMLLETFSRGH